MGLPMFFGPLVGTIMDRFSLTIDGVTSFSTEGFNIAFLIFPLGFFTALCLLSLIKEQLAVFKTN
jgi:hypothetical protein